MLKELFKKRQYATIPIKNSDFFNKGKTEELQIINNSNTVKKDFNEDEVKKDFLACKSCNKLSSKEDWANNLYVCPHCEFHEKIDVEQRIDIILDKDTFVEMDTNLKTLNPLNYSGYDEKIKYIKELYDTNEAIKTGEGLINGINICIAFMDTRFIMGSMGSVVGEKLVRLIENSIEKRLPLIVFCASGGARMQEGIISLMQMAKVSAGLNRLSDRGILYIPILTNPTTGGVTASFAMLGDYILAEPLALIGFAGKRVIEQTIKQKLPDNFQTSEFLLEHGFIDKIVKRSELKNTLYKILKLHS